MEIGFLITLLGATGVVSGMVFGYVGYRRGSRKDMEDASERSATLISDVGYIKSGIDDLKRKQENAEARHYILAERVTKMEESAKQAHRRIDHMER